MTARDVRRIREALGMTQEELGKALGYGTPQVRVSEIENGKERVSPQIERLLRYLQKYGKLP